jgi:hypothetical protein
MLRISVFALMVLAPPRMAHRAPDTSLVGRWDLTVTAGPRTFPSWLEVTLSGNRVLVGRFVGQVGSARPIARIEFATGSFHFTLPPQWDGGNNDLQFEGHVDGDRIAGSMVDASGRNFPFTAVRAPLLGGRSAVRWGKPLPLFNGRDLTGWHPTASTDQWRVIAGVLTSPTPGANLVTDRVFGDFKLHVEFRYPADGNSGVYLRGRYEVQVEDTRGQPSENDHLAAIYGFLVPSQDAAGKPGDWQSFDITLVGRVVSVVLNGTQVICDQIIPGITGGALDSNEGAPGPILLQGDHSSIEYRNVVLTPAH